MFVYIVSEPGVWTVGHYDGARKWIPESDHRSSDDAADRCHWLNGGSPDKTLSSSPVEEMAMNQEG